MRLLSAQLLQILVSIMLPVCVFAQNESAGGARTQGPAGFLISMLPMLAIFGIFYFLLIRPQQQKAKEHQRLISNIKRGDRILASGGFYGLVTGLKGETLDLKIADNVKIELNRNYVSSVIHQTAENPSAKVTQK
ncbi:preprotein translocase subunit YajC [Elusimicrobiota bacterium]